MADILPHPSLSADEVDAICRRERLRLTQTRRGVVRFVPRPVLLEDSSGEFPQPPRRWQEGEKP